MLKFFLGFIFAALIAFAAYRAHSLSRSGAWGAFLEGSIIFGLGGWQWAVLLMAFFVSSSVLTRMFGKQKASLNEKYDKGGVRDIGQVLANGAIASIFAGLHFFFPGEAWTWMMCAASLAAVNADTWATELGVFNPTPPRLISTWKVVEKGTSGGISLVGILAASGGAALIALFASLLGGSALPTEVLPLPMLVFAIITLAGVLGSLFDSLLGATVQAIYHCPQCNKETERHPLHTCGTSTRQVHGWSWLNNDRVNLGCATMGALIGLILL